MADTGKQIQNKNLNIVCWFIKLTSKWSEISLNIIWFLGLDMSDEEMKGLFEKFDTDGSGSINVTEFLQGVRVRLKYLL